MVWAISFSCVFHTYILVQKWRGSFVLQTHTPLEAIKKKTLACLLNAWGTPGEHLIKAVLIYGE